MDPAPIPPQVGADDLPEVMNLTAFVTCNREYSFPGSQSDVYEGVLRLGGDTQQVAVKIFRYTPRPGNGAFTITQNRRISREARLWYTLEHPNLLPLLGLVENPGRPLGLVSPYFPNGNISCFLFGHEARESVIPGLLINIARGLNYLHEQRVVHGDLKPNNVLVDEHGNARICDFGLSKLLGQTGFTTDLKATLRYMAPELSAAILEHDGDDDAVQEIDTNKCLDYPCDIYSLAMTILEVVSGKEPFFNLKVDGQVWMHLHAHKRPNFRRYTCDSLTPPIQTLIEDSWCQEPTHRLDIVEVLNRLLEMFPTAPSQPP